MGFYDALMFHMLLCSNCTMVYPANSGKTTKWLLKGVHKMHVSIVESYTEIKIKYYLLKDYAVLQSEGIYMQK